MKTVVSKCPIEEAMVVLSGRWPTLILYYLKDGTKRFSELQRSNPTVSHRILTLQLTKLIKAGLVVRNELPGYPRHVEYSLTSDGVQLLPYIDAIGAWWEKRVPSEDQAAGQQTAQSLLQPSKTVSHMPL